MLKSDLFRQLGWAIVPQGARTPQLTLAPGLTVELLVAGGKAAPPGGSQADLLVSMLTSRGAALGDEIDLRDTAQLAAVREVVTATFDMVRGALIMSLARTTVDDQERQVLAKLAELAA